MLGEFLGASVVFAQAIFKSQHEVDENNGRDDDNMLFSMSPYSN